MENIDWANIFELVTKFVEVLLSGPAVALYIGVFFIKTFKQSIKDILEKRKIGFEHGDTKINIEALVSAQENLPEEGRKPDDIPTFTITGGAIPKAEEPSDPRQTDEGLTEPERWIAHNPHETFLFVKQQRNHTF